MSNRAKSVSLYNDTAVQSEAAELEQISVMLEQQAEILAKANEAKAKKSVVPTKYKRKYAAAGHPGTCGDALASQLTSLVTKSTGVDLAALYAVASANGIDAAERWGHLNVGMQRMNLSNVLRNMAKNGHTVRWS